LRKAISFNLLLKDCAAPLSRWWPWRHFTQKSLASGACVCPTQMQQRLPVPDPQYLRTCPV